jgi:DNA-binding NarL/FixJ family response regulator
MQQSSCHHGTCKGKNAKMGRAKSKALTSKKFAAIFVEIQEDIHESLANTLKTGGLELIGVVSSIEEMAAISIRDDARLMIIIDSSEKAATTVERIEIAKELHPDSRIAVLVGEVHLCRLGPLFQAGAHACLDREANPKTIRKSLELMMQG